MLKRKKKKEEPDPENWRATARAIDTPFANFRENRAFHELSASVHKSRMFLGDYAIITWSKKVSLTAVRTIVER